MIKFYTKTVLKMDVCLIVKVFFYCYNFGIKIKRGVVYAGPAGFTDDENVEICQKSAGFVQSDDDE